MATDFIDMLELHYKDAIIDSHNFRGDQTITLQKNVLIRQE